MVAGYGARVKVTVHAGRPIVVVPEHSGSDRVLVGDLGNIEVTNAFLFDYQKGTIRGGRRFDPSLILFLKHFLHSIWFSAVDLAVMRLTQIPVCLTSCKYSLPI